MSADSLIGTLESEKMFKAINSTSTDSNFGRFFNASLDLTDRRLVELPIREDCEDSYRSLIKTQSRRQKQVQRLIMPTAGVQQSVRELEREELLVLAALCKDSIVSQPEFSTIHNIACPVLVLLVHGTGGDTSVGPTRTEIHHREKGLQDLLLTLHIDDGNGALQSNVEPVERDISASVVLNDDVAMDDVTRGVFLQRRLILILRVRNRHILGDMDLDI
ncbi:hypothetical protein WICPIJ_004317 [Wickerhamomyces pijperi]|uniref:Uncharacterized protein n=1 Tax=Wickerhamomyces pijperi TaxID=599730 RepID=A0A9P8Q649_WICPI|nr:hypothetical protein WICPIJ_004317 [Wickerhamomyces pijperi]